MQINNQTSLAQLFQSNNVSKAEQDFASLKQNQPKVAASGTTLNLSVEGQSKAELEKEIGSKYDVRNMSYNEYFKMADELYEAGLIESSTYGWMKIDLGKISEETFGAKPKDYNAKHNFLEKIQSIYEGQLANAHDEASRNGAKSFEKQLNMLKALDKYQ